MQIKQGSTKLQPRLIFLCSRRQNIYLGVQKLYKYVHHDGQSCSCVSKALSTLSSVYNANGGQVMILRSIIDNLQHNLVNLMATIGIVFFAHVIH